MKIRTEYVYPPIPSRSMDWSAVDDDTYDGPGSIIGRGATEQEAIDDLKEQTLEREAERDTKRAISHAKIWDSFFDSLMGKSRGI